ncbi:hypothetical protein QW131_05585 [Roseibium salinum]|nr:hypothetical protein [Roseibium salinum]
MSFVLDSLEDDLQVAAKAINAAAEKVQDQLDSQMDKLQTIRNDSQSLADQSSIAEEKRLRARRLHRGALLLQPRNRLAGRGVQSAGQ